MPREPIVIDFQSCATRASFEMKRCHPTTGLLQTVVADLMALLVLALSWDLFEHKVIHKVILGFVINWLYFFK